MKRYALFLVCIFSSVICDDNQVFERAVALYEQTEYQQAYDTFISINPKSVAVWYNLGNCAYKTNNPEQARIFWQYALDKATASEQKKTIEHNIGLVENESGISHPQYRLQVSKIFKYIPLCIFQLLFLLSWFCLLFFIKKYKHGNKYRSLYFVSLLLITIITGIGLGIKYYNVMQRKGVIMKSNVSLFAGPDEQFHVLGALDQLSEVIIQQERPLWFKIKTNGYSGWVKQESIAVL